jgi:uncharacterized membrane protein
LVPARRHVSESVTPPSARRSTDARDERSVIRRETTEFARAIGFVDATFAIAATLLVTTLEPDAADWRSWSRIWNAVDGPLFAFALSFWVVTAYWWANHRFVATLVGLSNRLVIGTMAFLAFVVLLPFTTRGLGTGASGTAEVTTVLYAANVAVVSGMEAVLYRIAVRDRLYLVEPSAIEVNASTIAQVAPVAVFVASIPLALLGAPLAARWSWLALIPVTAIVGHWARRRITRATSEGR